MFLVIWSNVITSWVSHDRQAGKPCCSSHRMVWRSKWSITVLCTICSSSLQAIDVRDNCLQFDGWCFSHFLYIDTMFVRVFFVSLYFDIILGFYIQFLFFYLTLVGLYTFVNIYLFIYKVCLPYKPSLRVILQVQLNKQQHPNQLINSFALFFSTLTSAASKLVFISQCFVL